MARYRRRRSMMVQRARKSIQHVTSVIAQNPGNNLSVTHIFANAGAFLLTGTSVATARSALSNREQENEIGSDIGGTTLIIGLRNTAVPQIVDVVVWKRERQSAVPIPGTGLPTDANITTVGAQMAFRQEMPGRVFHYQRVAIATNQPRVIKIALNWKKFRMGKIRQGDFYGVTVFNRAGAATFFADIETRYKEWM